MNCLIHVNLLTLCTETFKVRNLADVHPFCQHTKVSDIACGGTLFNCVDPNFVLFCCRRPAVTTLTAADLRYVILARAASRNRNTLEERSVYSAYVAPLCYADNFFLLPESGMMMLLERKNNRDPGVSRGRLPM